jgi:hypothetical protein
MPISICLNDFATGERRERLPDINVNDVGVEFDVAITTYCVDTTRMAASRSVTMCLIVIAGTQARRRLHGRIATHVLR